MTEPTTAPAWTAFCAARPRVLEPSRVLERATDVASLDPTDQNRLQTHAAAG